MKLPVPFGTAVGHAARRHNRGGVSDGTRVLRHGSDDRTGRTTATHARDGEQHAHLRKSSQLQAVAKRHAIQWQGLRQQCSAMVVLFCTFSLAWGGRQASGGIFPVGRAPRSVPPSGQWAYDRKYAKEAGTKTFFKNRSGKKICVVR